jgi:hypothetical protein
MVVKGQFVSPTSLWGTHQTSFPSVTWRLSRDPADVLKDLIALQGYSVRGFAKILVGPEATDEQWETKRSELNDWLRGRRRRGNDPGDQNLERIADAAKVPADLLMLLYRHGALLIEARNHVAQALEVLPEPGQSEPEQQEGVP